MIRRKIVAVNPLLVRADRLAAEAKTLTEADACDEQGRKRIIRILAELQIVRDQMAQAMEKVGQEIEDHNARTNAIRSYRMMARLKRSSRVN